MDWLFDLLLKIVLYLFLVSVGGFIIKKLTQKLEKNKEDGKEQMDTIRPINMASMFLPFSILSFCLPIFLLFIIKLYPADYDDIQKGAMVAVIVILVGIGLYLLCFSLYGMVWKVKIEGEIIIHRTIWGRERKYTFKEITKCISNQYDELRVYAGKKRVFTITSSMNAHLFYKKIAENSIPIEYIKGATVDNHVVRPLHILWILPALGGTFMGWLFISLLIENANVGVLLTLLLTVAAFFCSSFTYLFDRTKIVEKKIYQSAFLKRKKELDFSQITHIQEEKNKGGTEFFGLYNKKERVLRIRKHNHGMILFEAKISREGIKWRNIRKQ